jgi:hypothetical protein
MKHLKEIILILNAQEKAIVRKYLSSHPENSRRLELFNLIESGKSTSDLELAQMLYQCPPHSAFSHLKARLETNILEIIFPNSLPKLIGEDFQGRYESWRHLHLTLFFLSREALLLAERELSKAQDLAQMYNLIPEQLLMRDLWIQHFSHVQGFNLNAVQADEVLSNLEVLKMSMEVKKKCLDLYLIDLCCNVKPEMLGVKLQRVILQARQANDTSCLLSLRYCFNRILWVFEKMKGNYIQAKEIAIDLIAMTHQSPQMFTKSQRLEACLSQAKIEMYLGCQDQAVNLTTEILSAASPGSWVELEGLELVFLGEVYQMDLAGAEKALLSGKRHIKLNTSKFHASLWNYYHANLEFLKGNYLVSLQLSNECPELLKHKSKWLLGLKTLEIYNFIKMGKFDLVEYKLNALKQLLKRQKNYRIDRGKYVCMVIALLIRKNFDSLEVQKYLNHSKRGAAFCENGASWEPFNFEVISVDQFLGIRDV